MLAWKSAWLLTAMTAPVQDMPAAAPSASIAAPLPPEIARLSQPLPVQPQPPARSSGVAGGTDAAAADIVVTAHADWEAPDPIASANAKSFEATQAVDRAVIGPVSMAYKKNVPSPFRRGVRNFLYNLREPVVIVNFLLQHKIGKAAETIGRFALNSTIGIAGLFDMAKRKPFRLPRRSNGFANTLGYYGIRSGPFLYLPIVGPTTVRDIFGGAIDRLMLPITLGQGVTDPKFAVPMGALGMLDHRAEFDETYKTLYTKGGDPYSNSRDFYLQRRQAEIDALRGRGKSTGAGMSEAPTAPIRLKRRAAPATETPATPQ